PTDPASPRKGLLREATDSGRQAVEPGSAEQAGQELEGGALGPRRDLPVVDLTSELDQHARDVDAHGTRIGARAAERRGGRKVAHRRGALEHGRQEDANRSGIGVAVRVTADLTIHGTDVETRAAA